MKPEQDFNATLCFLVKEDKVLLGFKALKIGVGCWNGYGGRIEEGETPRFAALRELREEGKIIGIDTSTEYVGKITLHNELRDKILHVVMHTYLVRSWEGYPEETEEVKNPTWFSIDQIPLEEMLEADQDWFPKILAGNKVIAEYSYVPGESTFGPRQYKLISSKLEIVEILKE